MKAHLEQLLCQSDFEEVGEIGMQNKRVLGRLIALTFHPDPLIGWRAVQAIGEVAARLSVVNPDAVREHLRRLFWLVCEESGGICRKSPEAMAEIVARRPELFAEYVPIILSLLTEMADEDLEHFRAGILWAIGRLGPLATNEIDDVISEIVRALEHNDAQVRGMAVWCLGRTGRVSAIPDPLHDELLADEGTVDLYDDGVLAPTQVKTLAERAFGSSPLAD